MFLDRPQSSESNLKNSKSKIGALSPESNTNGAASSCTSPSSPNTSTNKLSSSFSSSNNTQMYNAFINNVANSSKTKPFAPRAKFSATLGAASGAEVLKQINTFESNTIGNAVAAGIKKELLERESAEGSSSSVNSTVTNNEAAPERKSSIARIIRADSLQNLTNRVSTLVMQSLNQVTIVSNNGPEQHPTSNNSSSNNLVNQGNR